MSPLKDPIQRAEYQKLWYAKNKPRLFEHDRITHQLLPWKRVYCHIKQRCENNNSTGYNKYGAIGIKCLISVEELKELWFRDKAFLMEKPSIDRINSKGDYCFENCQFLEHRVNSCKRAYGIQLGGRRKKQGQLV